MKQNIFIKRIFIFGSVLAAVLLFLTQGYGDSAEAQEMTGITGVTKGSVDLAVPPDTPHDKMYRYEVGYPFQVAPHMAALYCGIIVSGTGNIDYTYGADLILFDDLTNISSDKAIPLTRNSRTPGEPIFTMQGVPLGGFVPFGAKLQDGSAHPYAGTGFGLNQARIHEIDQSGHFDYQKTIRGYSEIFQFAYDENGFRVLKKERVAMDTLLSGCKLSGGGFPAAIPDGKDLLYVMTATIGNSGVSGVARWAHRKNGWRPVSFVPVTGHKGGWGEPSLIRDADGNLLFSARGSGNENFTVAVWRSLDDGETWKQVIHQKDFHARSPISVNKAADGSLYIAANLFPKSRKREILCLWPLNADGTELGELLIARDARGQFGPAPSGSWWRVDHPISSVLRLADGKWHGVLTYHIVDNGEVEGFGSPTPHTGCYVEEVLSKGKAMPAWRF